MPDRRSLALLLALVAPPIVPSTALHASNVVALQGGGALGDALVVGDVAYLAQGPAISIWRLASDGSAPPQQVSATEPLPGLVQGLAAANGHLFASYRSNEPSGGLAIYSLGDPEAPQFVRRFAHTAVAFASPGELAAIGDQLLLFDSEAGLHSIDVSDPVAPVVDLVLGDAFGLARGAVTGTHLVGWGRTFIGTMIVATFDVSDPAAPGFVGSYSTFGNFVDGALEGDLLVLVGDGFETVDVGDPTQPTWRATVPTPSFAHGAALVGTRAYLGDVAGLHVWDLSDPADPEAGVTLPAAADRSQRFARHPLPGGVELLVFTEAGHGLQVDVTTAAAPTLESSFDLPVGGDPSAIDEQAGELLIADFYSGLRVADGGLGSVGRHDTGILMGAHEDLVRQGDVAFLAAWGFGLLTFDVSDPSAPEPLGDLPFDFATAVDVEGGYAYLVSSTNGGVFAVVDVTDPAEPELRGTLPLSKGHDVLYHQGLVLIADENAFDTGGLRIVDPSVPAAPVQVGHYTACDSAGGVAALDDLAAVACHDGSLHLVDLSVPSAPVQLGVWSDPSLFLQGSRVAIDGGLAYFGHTVGVELVAIDRPATPRSRGRIPLAFPPRGFELAADGRLWTAAGAGGVYLLAPVVFRDGFESGTTGAWSSSQP